MSSAPAVSCVETVNLVPFGKGLGSQPVYQDGRDVSLPLRLCRIGWDWITRCVLALCLFRDSMFSLSLSLLGAFLGCRGGLWGSMMCPQLDTLSGFSWLPFGNRRHHQEVECPRYIKDLTGTHVGCHFDEAVEAQRMDAYFFWVNGTSNETAIQFSDFSPFKAIQIGKPISPRVLAPRGGHPASLNFCFCQDVVGRQTGSPAGSDTMGDLRLGSGKYAE